MTLDDAIQQHGAMAIFEAAAEGECGDLAPLRNLGLAVETIEDAEKISPAAYRRLSLQEKTQCHWEASQDLHKRLTEVEKT